jgi:hypothetical protein
LWSAMGMRVLWICVHCWGAMGLQKGALCGGLSDWRGFGWAGSADA